jgi:tRNA-dihydrouridine synthase B
VATGTYTEPTEADRHQLLMGYFQSLIDSEMPDAIGKMKQFATYFTHGVRNGGELRQQVHHSHSATEILARVDEFFSRALTS